MAIQLTTSTGSAIITGTGEAILVGADPTYIGSLPVFAPPKNPDLGGAAMTEAPDLYSVRFGDGYTQEAPKGLNSITEQAQFNWGMLRVGERDLILTFFRERGGYRSFWYRPPGDRMVRWKCKQWSRNVHASNASLWSVSASFIRSYDPAN